MSPAVCPLVPGPAAWPPSSLATPEAPWSSLCVQSLQSTSRDCLCALSYPSRASYVPPPLPSHSALSLSLSVSLDQQEHQPRYGWGARSLCTSRPHHRIELLTLGLELQPSDPPLSDRAIGHHRRCLPVRRRQRHGRKASIFPRSVLVVVCM